MLVCTIYGYLVGFKYLSLSVGDFAQKVASFLGSDFSEVALSSSIAR